MHFTLIYLNHENENKNNQSKSLFASELGETVYMQVDKVGVYFDGNTPLNLGAELNKDYLKKMRLPSGRSLYDISTSDIPHVTIAINQNAQAKAVDTQKCFWTKKMFDNTKIEERENPYAVCNKVDNFVISGRIAAFKGGEVVFELEDTLEETHSH